jgi:tripartite-type tricarboxylate transporter receptor subunit TctC
VSSFTRLAAALTFVFIANGSCSADDFYPTHPIRLVVPFVPGGAVDLVGRLAAQYLTDELGQQVFVDNRSGAGGAVGSAFVANAPADGYTLVLHSVSSAVINGLVYRKLPFDPRNGFAPIAEIAESPTLLVINADLPATTLQEFIALAKQNPGKFNFGSTGAGGSVHLAGVLFETKTGTTLVHIPFHGAGPAVAALVAGETQMEIGSVSAFLPFIRAGELRALSVNSEQRIELLPDVPTAEQAGLPGYILPDWYGMFAPRGTPAAVVARLEHAISKIVAKPQMRQRLADLAMSPVSKSSAEFATFWNGQFDFWTPIVKAAGVTLD